MVASLRHCHRDPCCSPPMTLPVANRYQFRYVEVITKLRQQVGFTKHIRYPIRAIALNFTDYVPTAESAPREKPLRFQLVHGRIVNSDPELSTPCGYLPSRQSSSSIYGNSRPLLLQPQQARTHQYCSEMSTDRPLVDMAAGNRMELPRKLTLVSRSNETVRKVHRWRELQRKGLPPSRRATVNLLYCPRTKVVAAIRPRRGSSRRHTDIPPAPSRLQGPLTAAQETGISYLPARKNRASRSTLHRLPLRSEYSKTNWQKTRRSSLSVLRSIRRPILLIQ
ncbi:hypothetical protein OH76DRAFT_114073 [Lentinus brumalis]|uniref:Uncharacterized protein n=1 Tax=Lentinus brumalis TaxID=2498619 RepID=A0A371CPV5_9APHY|nr:hypothetical protein OH76DRAFT_114073 [Polyporus brumalis]